MAFMRDSEGADLPYSGDDDVDWDLYLSAIAGEPKLLLRLDSVLHSIQDCAYKSEGLVVIELREVLSEFIEYWWHKELGDGSALREVAAILREYAAKYEAAAQTHNAALTGAEVRSTQASG